MREVTFAVVVLALLVRLSLGADESPQFKVKIPVGFRDRFR